MNRQNPWREAPIPAPQMKLPNPWLKVPTPDPWLWLPDTPQLHSVLVVVAVALPAPDQESDVHLEQQWVDPRPVSGEPPRQLPRRWQRMRLQWQRPTPLLNLPWVPLPWLLRVAGKTKAFQALVPWIWGEVEAAALGPEAPQAWTRPVGSRHCPRFCSCSCKCCCCCRPSAATPGAPTASAAAVVALVSVVSVASVVAVAAVVAVVVAAIAAAAAAAADAAALGVAAAGFVGKPLLPPALPHGHVVRLQPQQLRGSVPPRRLHVPVPLGASLPRARNEHRRPQPCALVPLFSKEVPALPVQPSLPSVVLWRIALRGILLLAARRRLRKVPGNRC
mmetsp:Transcript_5474/g.10288  ORF Transcript_5474/g.10288 Transcript_5474/m.10288 type:complete len:334 (-) Transcript_5474:150-1151(-)